MPIDITRIFFDNFPLRRKEPRQGPLDVTIVLLPESSIMSLASVVSKVLVPGVLLPVGIVTSMIGVPVFLVLILRKPERV